MIKNNKIPGLVLGFVLLFLLKSNAQDFDLAGITSVTYPNSGVKVGNQNAEFSFQEFGASINIPYKFKNSKTVLVNGLSYGWIENSGAELSFMETGKNKEQLQALYYQLMLMHKLNNNWRLLVSLRPTIASDFDEAISTNDFVLQGVGFAMKQVNEEFSIGGGLAYTMRFGKPFAVPVLPLNYKKGKHSISAMLPIKSTYNYNLGKKEKVSIGVKHLVNGAQFNITAPNTANYDIPEVDKISYTRTNIGAVLNYDITKFLRFQVYGGASIRRQYELIDVSQKTHKFDLTESPFIQFGISVVPPKKKM